MADGDRARRMRGLLAALACLPAAAAHAKVGSTGAASAFGEWNQVAFLTLAMIALGTLGGWIMGRPSTAPRDRPRARLARWLLVLGGVWLVACTGLVMLMGTSDDPAWWDAALTLQCAMHVAMGGAFLLGHAASLGWRSPRRWRVMELAALTTIVALATALGWNLGGGGMALGIVTGGLVVLSLVGASLAALGVEAPIAPRAHWRALRLGIAASLTLVAIVGTWLRLMGPRQLEHRSEVAASAGPWMNVWGDARWPAMFEPGYLLEVESGRWIRLGVTRWWGRCGVEPAAAWFSADGRLAAWWPTSEDESRTRTILVMDLDASTLRPRRLRSALADPQGDLVLSPSGRFLLVREAGELAMIDVGADRVIKRLADITAPGRRLSRVDDDGRLQVILAPIDMPGRNPHRIEIHRADAQGSALRMTASIDPPAEMTDPRVAFGMVDDSRVRVSWRSEGHRRLALHDARDGSELAVIADGDGEISTALMVLGDGRLVHPGTGRASLEVLSADGVLERVVPVPIATDSISLIGEHAPGRLVVHIRDPMSHRVALVDLDRGETVALPDLQPIDRMTDSEASLGSLATRLFRVTSGDDYGALIELDWATGARRVVLPR